MKPTIGRKRWWLNKLMWIYILAENIWYNIYCNKFILARFIYAWLVCRPTFEKGIYSVIDTWLLYGATGYQSMKSNIEFQEAHCKVMY